MKLSYYLDILWNAMNILVKHVLFPILTEMVLCGKVLFYIQYVQM